MTPRARVEGWLKALANRHVPGDEPDVLLFATPRGGSTWLAELIASQPGFKVYNEPFDVRKAEVRRLIALSDWDGLYAPDADEALVSYLRRVQEGRIHDGDLPPRRGRSFRWRTHRIVFKILHAGHDRVGRLADALSARPVILIRHPIAVSLSRKALPRLEALWRRAQRSGVLPSLHDDLEAILHRGTHLERGVLDWCLQTLFTLRQRRPEWPLVTYEQLVLEPEPVLRTLAHQLALPRQEWMLAMLTEASAVRHKSDAETRALLADASKRERLVAKWRAHVGADEEARAMRILERFELDLYRPGASHPGPEAWIEE